MIPEAFWALHAGNRQEAPGSDLSTAQALTLALSALPGPGGQLEILDVGCGPGRQTLVLARNTSGRVTAVDSHQPFLDELRNRADAEGLGDRVITLKASMESLPLPPASVDLIWSEGAVYIMGFEEGISAWKRLLKPEGVIAATHLCWLTPNPPAGAKAFWEEAYPDMTGPEACLDAIERQGYDLLGSFTLPPSDWAAYYEPLAERAAKLREEWRDDPEAAAILDAEEREQQVWRRWGSSYGYVFFLMQARRS